MSVPHLSVDDVRAALSALQNVSYLDEGGQKIVFSCEVNGHPYVVKFLLAGTTPVANDPQAMEATIPALDAVTSRARREVDTMARCDIPALVKLGPIGLTPIEINGQPLLYFTEEKVEGKDLRRVLQQEGTLSPSEVVLLGQDVTNAIEAIWQLGRIHRDIKPGNIMHCDSTGRYVLLDVGMVFDLRDVSLTAQNLIAGTPLYFSPEQMQYAQKRQLDFRSDLFALGTVLYESATGAHPFAQNATSTYEVLAKILSHIPEKPHVLQSAIPEELGDTIMRLLRKEPHLRYRNCSQLRQDLGRVEALLSGGTQ